MVDFFFGSCLAKLSWSNIFSYPYISHKSFVDPQLSTGQFSLAALRAPGLMCSCSGATGCLPVLLTTSANAKNKNQHKCSATVCKMNRFILYFSRWPRSVLCVQPLLGKHLLNQTPNKELFGSKTQSPVFYKLKQTFSKVDL